MPQVSLPSLGDPYVVLVLYVCAGLIVLMLIARFLRWRREARYASQRRQELRQRHGFLYVQQQEVQRLASRIIATSSQATIAGFEITRQIEALFTDGHPTPTQAVDVLKAMAAEKGANALINLDSQRQANQRFGARGDAVLVRPTAAEASAVAVPPNPEPKK